MLALLTWSKDCRLDVTEGATLDLRTWQGAGRFMIETASIGDETANNVIKPWRLIVGLLKLLNTEQDVRMAVGMLQAPPTEAYSEDRAPGEAVGGVWERSMGE